MFSKTRQVRNSRNAKLKCLIDLLSPVIRHLCGKTIITEQLSVTSRLSPFLINSNIKVCLHDLNHLIDGILLSAMNI